MPIRRDFPRTWPMFAPEAVRAGAHAAFAFPLLAGEVCFGVLELYRDRRGALTTDSTHRVEATVELLTRITLDELFGELSTEPPGSPRSHLSPDHAHVHQAAGMLAVRLGLSVSDAMARLRAAAYTRQLAVAALAEQVLAGRAHLEKDAP